MTVRQVADHFGVTHNLVCQWLRKGYLAGEHFGHVWMIPPEAVRVFKRWPHGKRRTAKAAT